MTIPQGHDLTGLHTTFVSGGNGLLEVVQQSLSTLTPAYKNIANYLLQIPEEFMVLPIQHIAEKAEVSQPSVIRFCRHFGYKGLTDFRIALAMTLAQTLDPNAELTEPSVLTKAVMNRKQKEAIGAAAQNYIGDAKSILLDSGSTMQIFAKYLLQAPPMSLMTTGLNVAEILGSATQHRLMLPGGVLRPESRSLTGELVEKSLAELRFDILFLGADAIDSQFGLSTYSEAEARQNGKMIEVSTKTIVLADSTKFGARRLHRCCPIESIDLIITDCGLPDDIYAELCGRGVAVSRVEFDKRGTNS